MKDFLTGAATAALGVLMLLAGLFAYIAVVCALLSLSACGGGGDDGTKSNPGPPDCESHPERCV